MLKKLFLHTILLSFLSLEAYAAESGGMPQLNPEFWISQIFWLILTFGILLVVLSKLILPKVSANLESRKAQILENVEIAEKQRKESELKIEQYDELIAKSKVEAKNIITQTKDKIQKDINLKKDVLDKQLDEEIKKAEDEIEELKKGAPEKVNKIAIEMSSQLIKKLIGAEVNASSISAIVDDLSKKDREKYYGN
jgi:F-type H+-transporting ATPase subunit b